MLDKLSPAVLVAAVVIVAIVVAADVVLTVSGYGTDAAALPVLIGGLATVITSQVRTHAKVDATNAVVTHALDGGMQEHVEAVVGRVLTRMAAIDERKGTTTVADAAAQLAPAPVSCGANDPPPATG